MEAYYVSSSSVLRLKDHRSTVDIFHHVFAVNYCLSSLYHVLQGPVLLLDTKVSRANLSSLTPRHFPCRIPLIEIGWR